jgi:hypothetical protein
VGGLHDQKLQDALAGGRHGLIPGAIQQSVGTKDKARANKVANNFQGGKLWRTSLPPWAGR